jgi:pteridine reductase
MSTDSNIKKMALITGAARRVGREIAIHYAEQGYAIGVHYHTSTKEAVETLHMIEKSGSSGILLQADLRDPVEIERLFDQVDHDGLQLQLLVNSASMMPESDLMKISINEWDDIFNVNLRSVWFCCQQAARRMKAGGVILNLSDVGANKNWTGFGAYVVSKSAVETLTRILARELAPEIRVCGIAPGLLLKKEDFLDSKWEKLVQKIPMESQGSFSDLLTTMDMLVNNQYITGEIITLAGGNQLG